jgi:hypothetical protein
LHVFEKIWHFFYLNGSRIVGSWGELGRLFTLGQKQTHKWVGYHILIQNLRTIGLWVLLLIKCSTSAFSSNVRLLTHTCHNSLPLKCDYIHSCEHVPPSSEVFSSHLHSHLHRRCRDMLSDHHCHEDFWYNESVKPFFKLSALI